MWLPNWPQRTLKLPTQCNPLYIQWYQKNSVEQTTMGRLPRSHSKRCYSPRTPLGDQIRGLLGAHLPKILFQMFTQRHAKGSRNHHWITSRTESHIILPVTNQMTTQKRMNILQMLHTDMPKEKSNQNLLKQLCKLLSRRHDPLRL
jgi:hypothetical protein